MCLWYAGIIVKLKNLMWKKKLNSNTFHKLGKFLEFPFQENGSKFLSYWLWMILKIIYFTLWNMVYACRMPFELDMMHKK